MTSYAFFDVETPNRRQDSICSIGVQRTNDAGRLEYSQHFYVNPEQGFDPQNTSVHGISPSQVQGAPTFDQLWQSELAGVFADAVAVAHNAPFDMGVLNKALSTYGLAKPDLDYYDTLDIAKKSRRLVLPDYELPTMCAHYGIVLAHHHDALADAEACRGIFWAMDADFGPIAQRPMPYVWVPYDPRSKEAVGCDAAMRDLYGIMLGIDADRVFSHGEEAGLHDWMHRNATIRNTADICDVFDTLEAALEDGVITLGEWEGLLDITRTFVTKESTVSDETRAMQQLIGYLRGITCDRHINAAELRALRRWCNSYKECGSAEFSHVRAIIKTVLADGVVTSEEEAKVLLLFDKIINPVAACEASCSKPVVFEGNKFVLTGDFAHGTKEVVAAYIQKQGGVVVKGVSGKVAYVVQGSLKSDRYAFGEYGTKVRDAKRLQDKGKPIQIITEDALYA